MCQKHLQSPATHALRTDQACAFSKPAESRQQAPEAIVHSLKEALQVDENIRCVGAGHDLDYPPVPFPSLRVIRSAGEGRIRDVVTRHHALLRDTAIANLFDSDPGKFAEATARAADFIVEACGGTRGYTPVHGHTCMRTRHFPFTIDESAREIWLNALWQALDDTAFPADVREEYWNWLEAMSIRMINRRTAKAQPARYPYAWMMTTVMVNGKRQLLPA